MVAMAALQMIAQISREHNGEHNGVVMFRVVRGIEQRHGTELR
jgi:hypothetical protein